MRYFAKLKRRKRPETESKLEYSLRKLLSRFRRWPVAQPRRSDKSEVRGSDCSVGAGWIYNMKPVVYVLYFKKSDKFYIGSTTDITRRLKQHLSGHTPTTKRLGEDFDVVFQQEVSNIKLARNIEKRIKSWKRKDYIMKIISDGKITFLNNKGP